MPHLQQVRDRVRGERRWKEGIEAVHDLVLLLRAGGGPLSSQSVVRSVRDSTVKDSLKFDSAAYLATDGQVLFFDTGHQSENHFAHPV